MLRCRHAAALLAGIFLAYPTLIAAQETAPTPGLPDLSTVDVSVSVDMSGVAAPDISVSVDVPAVAPHTPDFTDFNDSDPATTLGEIVEDVIESAAKKGNLKPNPKEQVDDALESARKKGEKPNPKEAIDETLERMNKGDLINKLQDELEALDEELRNDAQLANIDLQLQRQQQQTLQTMSNVSKALHDTAMAIIRKIGGVIPDPAQFGDPKEDIEK